MQSEASSSSPKRSASECPSHDSGVRSPPADEVPILSPPHFDQDIDTYMAEQENSQNPDNVAFPTQNGFISPVISAAEKLSLIQNLLAEQMQVGHTWYLVSMQWYKRWQKACKGEVDKEGALTEEDLGPVDNSLLLDEEGNLILSVEEGVNAIFIPQEAWSYFTTWLVHIYSGNIV